MGKIIGILVALLLVAGLAGGGAWFYGQHVYSQPGPTTADGQPRFVTIDKGSATPAVAQKLEAAGAVKDDLVFKLAVRFTKAGPKLKAGEYAINSGASIKDIIEQITEGRVVLYGFTAAEGLTSAMIMRKLAAETELTGPVPETTPAEGVLLPETYMVQRGETRAEVVSRMIAAQKKLVDELWARRQEGLPFDTPEKAIILASIVEKETGLAKERPMVAAVFVNRLRKSIRLESDPTIIYGVCKLHPERCVDGKLVNDKGERRVILQSEIDMDTGYNTYRIDALPPTPICNPGADSIRAVLNPPVSEAMFFVADGSGGHAFASTYAEHQANVVKWRKILATTGAALGATPAVPAPVGGVPAATPPGLVAKSVTKPAATPAPAATKPEADPAAKPAPVKPAASTPAKPPATTPAPAKTPAAPPG